MLAEAVDQFVALEAVGGRLAARFCYTMADDRGKGVRDEVGVDEGGASGCASESWAGVSRSRLRVRGQSRRVGGGVNVEVGGVRRLEDWGG